MGGARCVCGPGCHLVKRKRAGLAFIRAVEVKTTIAVFARLARRAVLGLTQAFRFLSLRKLAWPWLFPVITNDLFLNGNPGS